MWPLVLALGCPKSSRTSGDAEPPVAPWTSHPLLGTPLLGLAVWGWILHFWGGSEGAPKRDGSCLARLHPEFCKA